MIQQPPRSARQRSFKVDFGHRTRSVPHTAWDTGVVISDAEHAPEILPVTAALRLRRFDPGLADDALLSELLAWYRDQETVRMVDGPGAPLYDDQRLRRMLHYLGDHGELYLIEQHDWRPIGDVTLQPDAVPIVLSPAARGRGVGRAVMITVIERARALGRHTVEVSDIYDDNEPSRRLFTSLGFVPGVKTELGRRYSLQLL